jgi:hypothetical protein
LEYYDGLLFLTTNRPVALDEAFKSRIHLSLYYPPLDEQQTMEIWKMNIDRLRMIEKERCKDTELEHMQISEQAIMRLVKEKFNEHKGRCRWNGRQIRNAIQIDSSLAHFDARKDHMQPKLTAEHFKMIHVVTEDFDSFMQETVGKTDGEMAYERGDRADHWIPEQTRFGDFRSYGYGSSLSQSGGLSGRGMGLGQRHPSVTGLRQPDPFDRHQDDQSNFLGLQPQSPNHLRQRPSLERPPSISVDEGQDSESGHRERSPCRRYFNEQGLGDGYHEFPNVDLSPHDTNGVNKNGCELAGSNFRNQKHGLHDSDSEHHVLSKRRKNSDRED